VKTIIIAKPQLKLKKSKIFKLKKLKKEKQLSLKMGSFIMENGKEV